MEDREQSTIQSHIDNGEEVPPELVEVLHAETDETIDEDAYKAWMTKREGR